MKTQKIPYHLHCQRATPLNWIAFVFGMGIFIMENRKCCKCNNVKTITSFVKDKRVKNGYGYICNECNNERNVKYKRTKHGVCLRIYEKQIISSKKRNHNKPEYTLIELENWMLSQNQFHILYNNWVKSNYSTNLKPSIDRINDYKGYSFDNIQLMTVGENINKSYKDVKSGKNTKNCKTVLQYSLNNDLIKEYYSIRQASRETKIDSGSIVRVCKGEYNTTNGYYFKYKSN